MNAAAAHVIANGHSFPWPHPGTIDQFLTERQLPARSVVVEHNGEAVAPSEFPKRLVLPGDRLEIVRVVAGG